ncbi:MAG TPA: NAD(P)H-binding protein [Pseudonocardiaceae bacterium]|nr:NAD(P)H-binding protein [Pseudonocardiaceae bacterium]
MIVVTGATGRVGGQVVAQLRDQEVRALTRKPADLPVDTVRGDLSDPDSVARAVDGADAVFLVFPSLRAHHVAPQVVEALATVPRIVYLSAAGVDHDREQSGIIGSHAMLERLIMRTGTAWTFLRASGFAANTLGWAGQIRAGDTVRWFHGAARRSLIHEHDIAAVGVRALTQDGHAGWVHHITGPAQLTQVQQVAAIGDAIGRPLRFEQLAPDAAKQRLFGEFPDDVAQSIMDAHAAMVDHPEPVTDTVERITGEPALPFARWAADHAADFR